MDAEGGGDQPGPEFFDVLWNATPNQPAMWTEDQGWFDVWGMAHRVRWIEDQLYGMARFFAMGGSFHNMYMLTGGNNYGYKAGRYSVTAYAPDTVIDSFLLRHEPKFSVYTQSFKIMINYRGMLLNHPPARGVPLNSSDSNGEKGFFTAEAHVYRDFVFLSNYGESRSLDGYFEYHGHSVYLPNHTVVLLDTSADLKVLFNTSSSTDHGRKLKEPTRPRTIQLSNWNAYTEIVGYGSIRSEEPTVLPEQLNLMDNKSDYLWYSFLSPVETGGSISIEPIGGHGGIFYIYVDGVFVLRVAFLEYVASMPVLLTPPHHDEGTKRTQPPWYMDASMYD